MSVTADSAGVASARAAGREFLGHPRGLAYIAFTEAWERFSFYGMQALLILYMTGHLLQPGAVENVAGFAGFRAAVEAVFGQLSTQALASQIFGLYVGLIYFTPVIGGLIGDRLTGRKRAVLGGAVLMAIGHFMMAFEATFLPALASLICGAGLLKGNLAAQVGNLYSKNDRRRDSAFTVYVTAINVGATVAPLVCGTLGELYGWHYGFGVAGVGMLIGIAIYVAGFRYLPAEEERGAGDPRPRLAPGDGRIVAALLVLLGITALFWIVQAQVWNVYPLWMRDFVDRGVFGFTVPVTWFQGFDSLAVLVLAPVVILLWRAQSMRGAEPSDLTKIALGCAFYGLGFLMLSAGQLVAGGSQVSLVWPVLLHLIIGIGYLYAAPIALSLVSRAAPPAVNAMMVGAYYLGIFVGGIVSGWLGRFYEPLQPMLFWAVHAGIAGLGAVAIIVLRPVLVRELKLNARV